MNTPATDLTPLQGFPRQNGAPAWLQELRNHSWQVAQRLSLPGPKDEGWRRTSLKGLDLNKSLEGINEEHAGLELPDTPLPGGAVLTDILSAARLHADTLEAHLRGNWLDSDKLLALNGALFRTGYFLYVPAGVKIDTPIRVVCRPASNASLVLNRSVIILGEGASVRIVEERPSGNRPAGNTGQSGDGALTPAYVEVVTASVGKGASLEYASIQQREASSLSYVLRQAKVADNGSVRWFICELGARLSRSDTAALLKGGNASSEARAVYLTDSGQHFDVSAGAVHEGEGSRSRTEARGAVGEQARAVYRGLGKILRGARGSDASQAQKVLLLGGTARADNNPALLIDERDVRADHSSASTPVDPEEVFYLMSRGIAEADARSLLVSAFIQPVLDGALPEGLQEGLQDAVSRKLQKLLKRPGGIDEPIGGGAE